MAKLVLPLTVVLLCMQVSEVESFQPSFVRKSTATLSKTEPLGSSVPGDFFWGVNPVNKMDLDHAHECADHFGQCKIQELEDMKQALHTERVQHQAASGILALDPVEELDHRLLEEDLSVQLALLKGEMDELLPFSFDRKVLVSNTMTTNVGADMDMDMDTSDSDVSYYHHRGNSIKGMIQQGEDLFLIPNGLGDAAVFCIVLFLIAFFPFLLH